MLVILFSVVSILISSCLSIDSANYNNAYQKASAEFEKYFKEQWMQQTLKYEGPDIKVKLTISDKIFWTSTHVLFDKRHGVTLFIHEFLGTDKNSINHECKAKDDEGSKSEEGTLFKFEEAVKDKMDEIYRKKDDKIVELYFDRNPELFGYILDYMRRYPMKSELYDLNVQKLEKLSADTKYFSIPDFEDLIQQTLYSRFNEYLCAPPSIALIKDSGRTLQKIKGGLHQGCSVYGVLYTGRRYVEFHITTHDNRYQMIGVTEPDRFISGPYPGHANIKGISLYGANGHLYRNGGSEGWSPSFHYGDRVGVLVDISEDKRDAKISWYINGKKIKQAKDLRQYMNIDNGVLFTVTMHDANEEVQIIQYPEMPKF